MKNTKELLKGIFGKHKDGLKLLQQLRDPKATVPTIFLYDANGGRSSSNILYWLSDLCGPLATIISEEQFYEGFSGTQLNVMVNQVSDVTDPFISKVTKTRSPKRRLIVACLKKPQILAYVSDPTLLVLEVPSFELEAVRAEIKDVLAKL